MALSIWQQAQDMRRSWPDFRVLKRGHWKISWEGRLTPFEQAYIVQVCLRRQRKSKDGPLKTPGIPCVTVVEPLLRRRDDNPRENIPHKYHNQECPEMPFLCLYYPDGREWTPRQSVAHTIVPWTIDWLACYEGWLATGKWMGGGRHPEGN